MSALKKAIQTTWTSIFGPTAKNRRRRANAMAAGDQLESRRLLATLVSANKLTYQDVDGDNVEVTFSKPIPSVAAANQIFQFDTGTVNGSNTTKQQLRSINLANLTQAAGTTISTKAVRSAANGGDGFAAIGQIDATGIDISTVTIDGDLGRILAGDATTTTQGLGALTVHSMGRFGTFTGATNLNSLINGRLLSLKSKTDIKEASIVSQGGNSGIDGNIGSVTIGGSLIGGAAGGLGSISSSGLIGAVAISGDIVGGSASFSGSVVAGSIASVKVGGSVLKGSGNQSGVIHGGSTLGAVTITGDLSGEVTNLNRLESVTIGGSLLTGGVVYGKGTIGTVKIAGNVNGFVTNELGGIANCTIGGSVNQGRVTSRSVITTLTITGNLAGGSASGSENLERSGYISALRVGTLTIGGSVIAGTDNTSGTFANNGAIRIQKDIGSLTIKGSVIGNTTNKALITALGQGTPSASVDLAIGKLTVTGRVELAQILGGVDFLGVPKNADAQIGPVVIGGDWIASDLIAGAVAGVDGKFGTADDTKMPGTNGVSGFKDVPTVFSKITSIVIGGQAYGTPGGTDHFGIVAQNIGSFKLKGGLTTFPLLAGNGNDNFMVGLFGDFRLRELL